MRNSIFKMGMVLLLAVSCTASLLAFNDLTVRDPADAHSQDKPGYIDTAVIVVEPHGGYTEQSLYLDYSDHDQFPGNDKLEIIHQFELPENAVVNDMWLWIGDSVMQAIMLDTWTASHIYDSIVVTRKDPCLVTKRGNQYIMNIYPLESGSYRRVKLNYIVPTRWYRGKPYTELPVAMLGAGTAGGLPLQVLFRTQNDAWGFPVIREQPQAEFYTTVDTAGYSYMQGDIFDWELLSSLTVDFEQTFTSGFDCIAGYQSVFGSCYYQVGLDFVDLFGIPLKTAGSRKKLIAMDLSGFHEKDLSVIQYNLTAILPAAVGANDSFALAVAVNGTCKYIGGDQWKPGNPDTVSKTIQSVLIDPDMVNSQSKPHILFFSRSREHWKQGYFEGIDDYASYTISYSPDSALDYIPAADIVSEYIVEMDESEVSLFVNQMRTFMENGGKFLSYAYPLTAVQYAHNFIDSFRVSGTAYYGKLYRSGTGSVAGGLPEVTDTYGGHYRFTYSDTDVVVEAVDSEGYPVIVSKAIGKGLLVINTLGLRNDEPEIRTIVSAALLGLNSLSSYHQLDELLDSLAGRCNADGVDECIILSNSEQLVTEQVKLSWIGEYLAGLAGSRPLIHGINLLTGSPYSVSSVTYRNVEYLGSGYQLKMLADSTGGHYYGLKNHSWDYITDNLFSAYPALESLSVEVYADGVSPAENEQRFVCLNTANIEQPVFVIGSTGSADSLSFSVTGRFSGMDSVYSAAIGLSVDKDSLKASRSLITGMLASETLLDYFGEPVVDTQKIVNLAIRHNILTDFTALLALEPDDSVHFMQEPLEENTFTPLSDTPDSVFSDSVSFTVEPNPFTGRATITIACRPEERISVVIYDLQGNEVAILLQESMQGRRKMVRWQGRDRHGETVKPGVYITAVFRDGKPEFLPVVKRKP